MKEINELLGLKPDATAEETSAAILSLQEENASLKDASRGLPKGVSAKDVTQKRIAGLTREQAIQVLSNQAAHDAKKPHDDPPKPPKPEKEKAAK